MERPAPPGPDLVLGQAEGQLRDGLERILRAGQARSGWALLVLHLSRLAHPRPHHRRVTAALLDNTAERCSGQLFGLANGDLALLFRPPDEGAAVLALIHTLFGAETRQVPRLYDLWPLPDAASATRQYLRDAMAEPPAPVPAPQAGTALTADRLLRTAPLPALLMRQTAVHLRSGQLPRILPLFRAITLDTRLAATARRNQDDPDAPGPDELVARLEQRMLAMARESLRSDDPVAGGLTVPLHLKLTPAGVMSEGFARFAAACVRHPAMTVAVELPLAAAFRSPAAFVMARERLRLTGMRFVLDHVSPSALLTIHPTALDPQWIKLDWDRAVADAEPELGAAIARLGPDRVVLSGCETEAALVGGLGLGIQRFQGGFVDTMLAAERLRSCRVQRSCSLLQCSLRASTLFGADRAGCLNHPLLDAAMPGPDPSGAGP